MTAALDPRPVLAAIRGALGRTGTVHLHEPLLDGNAARYVGECVASGWVSSAGAFVDRIECDLAAVTGHAAAVAVVNGTAALHAALHLAGVRPGDEVLVPSLTFVATANAVRHCGAIPHFVDVEDETLGLCPDALRRRLDAVATTVGDGLRNRETGRPLRAVVPMHAFGLPARTAELAAICEERGLALVEDAAEALGSTRGGRHVGHDGRAAILSFNGNKIVTTGGGGALLTNDTDLARRAKHLTTTAKLPHRWEFRHDEVAWNYRMPNLNAALGCAQLERLPDFLAAKRALHDRYAAAFEGVPGVRLVREPEGTRSNHWLSSLLLDERSVAVRDALLGAAHAEGLLLRPAWEPLHRLPMYRDCPRDGLSVTEDLAARLVNLPSSAFL